jgi:hypothetical protein
LPVLFFACTTGTPAPGGRDGGPPPDGGECPVTCEGSTAIACGGTRTECSGVCLPGRGCLECAPSSLYCADPATLRRCAADGRSSELVESCGEGEVCDSGSCHDPCAETPDGTPSVGCSFVAVPTLNSALGGQWREFMDFRTLGADGFHFGVALANPKSYPIDARIEGNGVTVDRTIAPGAIETIELPWVPRVTQQSPANVPISGSHAPYRGTPSVHEPDAAYRIETTGPVVAYQFNPINYYDDDPTHTQCAGGANESCFSYTNDASLLLPVRSLGKHYTVLAYDTAYQYETCGPDFGVYDEKSGYFTIVATEDDTTVTIVAPSALRSGPAIPERVPPGAPLTLELARGDVLELVADAPTDDECEPVPTGLCAIPCSRTGELTGTTIESDRPIAVFAGHDCAQVPAGFIACDHIEDQLWPDEALGRSYVIVPLYVQAGAPRVPTIARIVATVDGTEITLRPPATGVSNRTLGAGEFVELELYGPTEVVSSQPIAVAQYLVGDELTPLDSDPSMVIAVPEEQWRNDYAILVPESYPTSFLSIAAPRGRGVRVDGTLVTPFEQTARFDYYYLPVSPGQHRLEGDEPFTVLVSGHGPFVSYAYPGGGNLDVINLI